MGKQVKKDADARSRIPDNDQYTGGGPRPRPRARPSSPHADHPPKRGESLRKDGEAAEDHDESVIHG